MFNSVHNMRLLLKIYELRNSGENIVFIGLSIIHHNYFSGNSESAKKN